MNLKKILLVDGNPDCRELLSCYLDILRCPAPVQARDGEEALSKALTENPDLIIMEVRLPKIDGFEIVARLRRNPLTRDTRMLAATAQALPQDREKCLARGFNAYLAKPFSYKELGELLGAMFSRNSD